MKKEKKNNIETVCKIAEKTIGFDLSSVSFDEIGDKIKDLIEKSTNGKYTTNGSNGLSTPLVATRNQIVH